MGYVISYTRSASKRQIRKKEDIMYSELVNELLRKPANNYTINMAEELADRVLKKGGYDDLIGSTPIVKIAQDFGFTTYHEGDMPADVSGNIYIGGTTNKVYGKEKVIVVGDNEEFYHQRFIVAHELAHYLMDYIGSNYSQNTNRLFSRAYTIKDHNSPEEVRADRFAAELLMPAKSFYKQYMKAMETSEGNRRYAVAYLSRYFETKKSSIKRRIQELA